LIKERPEDWERQENVDHSLERFDIINKAVAELSTGIVQN
jgi:hypothetical protein